MVTGVQTCALPISNRSVPPPPRNVRIRSSTRSRPGRQDDSSGSLARRTSVLAIDDTEARVAMELNRRTAALVIALAALLPAATRMQAPLPAMPALHGEAIASDAARGRLVLFGGRTSRGWLSGTWEWDGRTWRRAVDSAASPPPRGGHALAYDGAGRRVFLFGGSSGPTRHCDTWTYDGARWTRVDARPCSTDRTRNA